MFDFKSLTLETRLQIARDPGTDAKTLRALLVGRHDASPFASEINSAVAAHRNTDRDLLGSMAYDDNPFVRDAVAGNPNTLPLHLAKLASDCLHTTCRIVASRADLPRELAALMAAHPYDLFPCGCEVEDDEQHAFLDQFSVLRYWEVGWALVRNKNTPYESLTEFWTAGDFRVKYWPTTIRLMREAHQEKYPQQS